MLWSNPDSVPRHEVKLTLLGATILNGNDCPELRQCGGKLGRGGAKLSQGCAKRRQLGAFVGVYAGCFGKCLVYVQ